MFYCLETVGHTADLVISIVYFRQGERGAQILVVPELVEFFQSSLVQVCSRIKLDPSFCSVRVSQCGITMPEFS